MEKIIVIVGPTASGKSDLAVKIAKKYNGEIISADSRQVYKGLDIGSGKITKEEMEGVEHYLTDVTHPETTFSVQDFKILATKAIEDIKNKGKIPIIVGGTGFYIDVLVTDVSLPEVPPNLELRQKLETLSTSELVKMLEQADKDRSQTIDKNNRIRLVRAIEIATALGSVPKIIPHQKYDPIFIGIQWPKEVLNQRIYDRLMKRLHQGMTDEVQKLHNDGLSWERLFSLGLEYRYVSLYLQGKMNKEEMIEKLFTAIKQYSKRQMTWFKRNKKINWVHGEEDFSEIDRLLIL
jgi:tRNA dimethylallyltransferase